MVIAAFPIAKLSVLLIKQISKPIANICKERAKNHPFFRTYVCMPPAQFYNWCEVKSKMWILNLGKPVNIPVLSQESAIELGANLLGEAVIFIIGAALLTIEYNRQSKKEAAKEKKREEEMQHITSTITDLYFTVQRQQTQLKEMERIIVSIGGPKPSPDSAGRLPQHPPPSPPGATAPTPSQPSSTPTPPTPIQTTPYPNKGIILQSLNYILMDVFSSVFPYDRKEVPLQQLSDEKHKREPAVLSKILNKIEIDFKSLF